MAYASLSLPKNKNVANEVLNLRIGAVPGAKSKPIEDCIVSLRLTQHHTDTKFQIQTKPEVLSQHFDTVLF